MTLFGVLVVVATAYAFFAAAGPGAGPTLSQAGLPLVKPPTTLAILDSSALEIGAGDYFVSSFSVSDTRPCTVSGHVLGLAGGNKDVEVMLLDDDALTNWKNHSAVTPIFAGSRATATTIKAALPGPGKYHLIVSNAFSLLTDKTAQVQAALRCE